MNTSDLQRRLTALGYAPGPVDGVRGPKTIGALRAFQSDHGLIADGVVGPLTEAAMDTAEEIKGGKAGGDVDPELIAQLKIDEGCRLTAYRDTVGVWTIGYGHAYVQPGAVWTQAQAEAQLVEDVRKHNAELAERIPWIDDLDPVRRRVLQNMAFNLGINGLLGFRNTLEFVRTGQYERAAAGMLASKWAKQVGQRAVRLAQHMRTGS